MTIKRDKKQRTPHEKQHRQHRQHTPPLRHDRHRVVHHDIIQGHDDQHTDHDKSRHFLRHDRPKHLPARQRLHEHIR